MLPHADPIIVFRGPTSIGRDRKEGDRRGMRGEGENRGWDGREGSSFAPGRRRENSAARMNCWRLACERR